MKKIFFLSLAVLCLSSCYNRIGSLTVVATRNVDPNRQYVELRRDVTAESRVSKGQALQEAIDRAVKSVPGGEFMTNCVVYVRGNSVVRVTGDVYGTKDNQEPQETGFKVGDQVIWLDDKNRRVKATITYIGTDEIQVELLHNKKLFNTKASRILK